MDLGCVSLQRSPAREYFSDRVRNPLHNLFIADVYIILIKGKEQKELLHLRSFRKKALCKIK